jgi:AcrR family transcriptional regulator
MTSSHHVGRPREHDETTREALLDAAEVLLADGPEQISTRAVANAVGTTTRAIYSLFGSKSGLIEAVAARGYRLLVELVSGVPRTDDPADDLVRVGVEGFRRFAVERPLLFRLTFERPAASITAVPEVMNAARASYEALAEWIHRAREVQLIHPDRSELEVAFTFHALCQGLASGELSREPPPVGSSFWGNTRGMSLEPVWRDALRALIHGLAAPPRRNSSS